MPHNNGVITLSAEKLSDNFVHIAHRSILNDFHSPKMQIFERDLKMRAQAKRYVFFNERNAVCIPLMA